MSCVNRAVYSPMGIVQLITLLKSMRVVLTIVILKNAMIVVIGSMVNVKAVLVMIGRVVMVHSMMIVAELEMVVEVIDNRLYLGYRHFGRVPETIQMD